MHLSNQETLPRRQSGRAWVLNCSGLVFKLRVKNHVHGTLGLGTGLDHE